MQPFHMVCDNDLTDSEQKAKRSCPTIHLNTANGTIASSTVTDIYVRDLDITLTALVLPETESALSMGKLITEHGFTVIWTAEKGPVLEKDGRRTQCTIHQSVPLLHVGTAASDQPNLTKVEGSGGNGEPTQPEPDPTQIDAEVDDKPTKPKRKKKKKVTGCNEHNIFTHFPKSDSCEICRENKTHRAYCRAKYDDHKGKLPPPEQFGDMLTADHKILGDDDESLRGDKVICVIQDKATYWLQAYPAPTKSADETAAAFKRFLGPSTKCKHVYTDNSKEFAKAFKDLQIDI